MSAADVLNVCFPLLRQQKTLNLAKIKAELEMLGVEASPEDIELAWASAHVNENLSGAISALEQGSDELKKKLASDIKANKATKTHKAAGRGKGLDEDTKERAKNSEKRVMNEITDYKIIDDKYPPLVASQVNRAIKQGWQPLGSMSIYRGGTALGAPRDVYYQVIVKYR